MSTSTSSEVEVDVLRMSLSRASGRMVPADELNLGSGWVCTSRQCMPCEGREKEHTSRVALTRDATW